MLAGERRRPAESSRRASTIVSSGPISRRSSATTTNREYLPRAQLGICAGAQLRRRAHARLMLFHILVTMAGIAGCEARHTVSLDADQCFRYARAQLSGKERRTQRGH